LWEAISHLNKDAHMTVVLITHYLEKWQHVRLNVLIAGKLYYSGDMMALSRNIRQLIAIAS
jgi:multidrug/hemolysin transport system ATP-binding protein